MQDDDAAYHIPVLLERSIELLVTDPQGIYVDGTLGGGGHSRLLLSTLGEKSRVFGFDQDPDAVRHARTLFEGDPRLEVVHENVVHLRRVLHQFGIDAIDGLLLDLGVSSHQIDEAERGFSFRFDGPLDMRMDRERSVTAADLITRSTEEELARIFFAYGEERGSRRIAHAIVRERARRPIGGTMELVEVISGVVSPAHRNKTLARIFQALRIAVNSELGVLEETLAEAADLLAVGGRLVVISYHSLEDRIVKRMLRNEAATCVCPPRVPVCVCGKVARIKLLNTRHIEADENEIRRNPRARSARLRAGEKIHA
ncbi:MAG: 16S rRNA (cytosine(1402)-N(4))-methyltransferase RsmH [Bacteroidota bacterium]|jgi:16S rRNA (cytosine1402-N4)-methyltransferase|nr:16S rRNA (cytosine(1402)-N(4))-methyltransferase RsmH [Bacteroidota bacterium]